VSDRTRAEHVRWCKERAIFELEHGGPGDAAASLCSDFGKHPETQMLSQLALIGALSHSTDAAAMRRFIEGFAE
jgi:hypothetical protein